MSVFMQSKSKKERLRPVLLLVCVPCKDDEGEEYKGVISRLYFCANHGGGFQGYYCRLLDVYVCSIFHIHKILSVP